MVCGNCRKEPMVTGRAECPRCHADYEAVGSVPLPDTNREKGGDQRSPSPSSMVAAAVVQCVHCGHQGTSLELCGNRSCLRFPSGSVITTPWSTIVIKANERVVLGRGEGPLREHLSSRLNISHVHASIEWTAQGLRVRDNDSLNGSTVAGVRLGRGEAVDITEPCTVTLGRNPPLMLRIDRV